jgi:hypothetical protein
MAAKNLFIYILVRLGLEPYNICTNPETGETPLEGRLCVYILQYNLSRLPDGFPHALQEKGENRWFLTTKYNSKNWKKITAYRENMGILSDSIYCRVDAFLYTKKYTDDL